MDNIFRVFPKRYPSALAGSSGRRMTLSRNVNLEDCTNRFRLQVLQHRKPGAVKYICAATPATEKEYLQQPEQHRLLVVKKFPLSFRIRSFCLQ